MDIIDKLKWRYATKEFDADKKLSQQQVDKLIEAANLTASSFGMQPVKVVLVENKDLREKLVDYSWGQRQVADASHLLVITINKNIGDDEVENFADLVSRVRELPSESLSGMSSMIKGFLSRKTDSEKEEWAANQAHIVLGNLLTVCAVEGIDSCPIAGFQPDKYDELLELEKEGQKSVLVLPVGYRSQNDKYIKRAKVRMDVNDFLIKR